MKSAFGKLWFFSSFAWVFIFLALNCSTGKNIKVQKIIAKPTEVESFAALLSIRGDTNKGKVKLNLELFFREPRQVVFSPRTSWGSGFFKAKVQENTVTIYFPKDKKYYKDDMNGFQKKLNWGWEIKLQELMDIIVKKNMDSVAGAEIQYKKFKTCENFDLPYEIEIKFRNTGKKVKISFREQKLNPKLADKLFQLEIPDAAQRVDLMGD
ncbi:MAG TPA: hypothetical protein VJ165_05435 [candidate division Zixibacteria bacterium]|nr:hypothetical protein [candidate division Zixibacteria bacterium]